MTDRLPNATVPGAAPSLLIVATVSGTVAGFLLPYAAHFRARGWRVEAAASGATSDPRLVGAFDRVHELPLSRSLRDVRGLVRARRATQRILESSSPDIVHVHTPIASFVTRLVVRQMPSERRPAVVYTAHGFHFHQAGRRLTNTVFLTAERAAGRWTDRLVVINEEDEAAALRHRIVPRRRLVRMPGIGLDTGRYAPLAVSPEAPGLVREQLGIAPEAPLFAIVGEINRNKRQTDAIDALGAMKHPGAHLVLAGRDDDPAALAGRAADAGWADRVHALGVIDDVRPIVRAATAVILASKREGLARSVMEALSLEVPVIASTARGNRELVGEDRGIVFPTGDVHDLAAAMDWMIDHPDERLRMGTRGRERMVSQYDVRVLLGLHEDLYRGVLAER